MQAYASLIIIVNLIIEDIRLQIFFVPIKGNGTDGIIALDDMKLTHGKCGKCRIDPLSCSDHRVMCSAVA